jgi:NAD-dependent dihydropyrimidine dehydrogenase PreA subunit
MSSKSAPRVEINMELCKGCGLCVAACPKKILAASGKLNKHGYNYTVCKDKGCIGCGICFYSCPEPAAVTVHKKGK